MAQLQVCGKMGTQETAKVDSLPFILGVTRRCLPQRMEMAFPGSSWKSRSSPAPEETHITLLLWLNYCSSLLKRQNITHLKRPSFHSSPEAGCESPVGGSTAGFPADVPRVQRPWEEETRRGTSCCTRL